MKAGWERLAYLCQIWDLFRTSSPCNFLLQVVVWFLIDASGFRANYYHSLRNEPNNSHHTYTHHKAKIFREALLYRLLFLFLFWEINLGGLVAAAFFPRKGLVYLDMRFWKRADNKKSKNINKKRKLQQDRNLSVIFFSRSN